MQFLLNLLRVADSFVCWNSVPSPRSVRARILSLYPDRFAAGRDLSDDEIESVVETYRTWRRVGPGGGYQDVPGFCKEATLEEIAQHRYALVPGRFVGFPEREVSPLNMESVRTELSFLSTCTQRAREAMDEAERLIDKLMHNGHSSN